MNLHWSCSEEQQARGTLAQSLHQAKQLVGLSVLRQPATLAACMVRLVEHDQIPGLGVHKQLAFAVGATHKLTGRNYERHLHVPVEVVSVRVEKVDPNVREMDVS